MKESDGYFIIRTIRFDFLNSDLLTALGTKKPTHYETSADTWVTPDVCCLRPELPDITEIPYHNYSVLTNTESMVISIQSSVPAVEWILIQIVSRISSRWLK